MANTIRIKRRAAGGASGAPSSLLNAELAYNEQDNSLYYGFGNSGGNATSIITIGGRGAFADLTTNQTIAGTKTFSSTITGSVSGNAGTATALATGRTISISGDLTYTSPSFDGSGNVTAAGTLATVNSNIGAFTKITINAKGLATAGSQASLTDIAAPTADWSVGNFKLTNVADPASAQDAATKAYVDSVAQGLDVKGSVICATTANITLSGTQTIDGVAVVAGNRVLVKNQTTTSQNGIYVVAAGAWSRATDMDAWTEVPGAFCFVEQGSTYADTGWACTADAGGTLNTTAITWAQFSGAGTYIAGNGLTLTGSTFDVVGTTNRISVAADSIDISANYVGQSTITTLGTITTGTWTGTTIAVANGGTGQTTYTDGQLLIGNSTGNTLSKATLTQGSGITITNGSGTISIANASPMVYPGAGIPNSTGSAWGTSYTTSGSGTVVALATGASLTTPSLSGETFSTSAAVTAGTNAQGQGALTSDYNVITTTGSNPSGVTLPTATTGRRILVVNKGTNAVSIYPATGAAIDALSANVAISLAVGGVMEFNAASTTQWYSSFNLSVTGTGVSTISFGTTGLTPSTATGGAVSVAGTLVVGNGGTGAVSFTSNGIVYGNGTSAMGVTAAGTWDSTNSIGQLLSVNSSGVPTWTNSIDCGTF